MYQDGRRFYDCLVFCDCRECQKNKTAQITENATVSKIAQIGEIAKIAESATIAEKATIAEGFLVTKFSAIAEIAPGTRLLRLAILSMLVRWTKKQSKPGLPIWPRKPRVL